MHFHSTRVRVVLYANAGRIVKVKEGDAEYYYINDHYYINNIEETSVVFLERMLQYKKIFDMLLTLFRS